MQLNLDKFLGSCVSFNPNSQRVINKRWASAKSLKTLKKRPETAANIGTNELNLGYSFENRYIFSADNSITVLNQKKPPVYSVKYIGVTNGKLGVLSKKYFIPFKNAKSQKELEHPGMIEEAKRVNHTFAIPKKLVAVKKLWKMPETESKSSEKFKIVVKRNRVVKRENEKSVKEFKAKEILERHNYYDEMYLKSLAYKYRETPDFPENG